MIKVEFERQTVVTLLAVLERRLEVIHQIESNRPEALSAAIQEERAALAPAIVALEQALERAPPQ